LDDRDCTLITSGMGLKRASQASRALIEATSPQFLVSVGVAGAVNADLEIGEGVACRKTCQLEEGVPGPIESLALLSNAAWQAAAGALQARRSNLYSGTAITTHGSQFFPRQPEDMPNPVLEMETVGIAQVAAEKGVPLLSLRAISDGPRSPIPFDLEKVLDDEYNLRVGEILKMVIRHPRLLLQSIRMGQNTRLAADNAACAMVAALSQLETLQLQR
jgi:adenosylhomocysteine nucleosidase